MLVKDHPEDETIVGKRVWNKAKTQKGTIVLFDPNDRYPSVDISWDNGASSARTFMMVLTIEIAD